MSTLILSTAAPLVNAVQDVHSSEDNKSNRDFERFRQQLMKPSDRRKGKKVSPPSSLKSSHTKTRSKQSDIHVYGDEDKFAINTVGIIPKGDSTVIGKYKRSSGENVVDGASREINIEELLKPAKKRAGFGSDFELVPRPPAVMALEDTPSDNEEEWDWETVMFPQGNGDAAAVPRSYARALATKGA